MQHNSLWFISDDNNPSAIFFYKIQTILVDYLQENLTILDKIFYFSDGCTGQYKNRKTLLICVIISKISVWMLNGNSLQLVMASHHAMVLGDLLNVTLKNVVYKDPYVTSFELPINAWSMCKKNSFYHIFPCKSGRNGQCSYWPEGLLCKDKDHAWNKE